MQPSPRLLAEACTISTDRLREMRTLRKQGCQLPDARGCVLADEEAVALAADELASLGRAADGGGLAAVGALHQVHPALRHRHRVRAHAARHSQRHL